ncbi:MAG TPA: AAA family ATPase [Gemmataceae bacterium]|nr:AAA family ATPase [Gemmataceae bacterium]
MRIQSITASYFKSLIDFKLDLAKFTCLIGLNGAGKSTVLQFIDFLARQVRGDLRGWLEERHWKPRDLNSRLTPRKNIVFRVSLVSDTGESRGSWRGTFNTSQLHCTSERIETPEASLEVQNGHLRILGLADRGPNGRDAVSEPIAFSYEGSVLSQLRDKALPPSLVGFKEYVASIKSLDLLSPEYLRQRTRESDGSIGLGGQRLSAFLHELGHEGRDRLRKRLRKVYPHLKGLETSALRSGWKQLEIREGYSGTKLVTEARHVNDGLLRLLAILAELQSDHHRFLLFDEIENGMNPELIEFVIDALTSCKQQVMVTTHSPMILNYLEDDMARAGVMYLYKTEEGCTRAIPFFSIPSVAKKLTVMGPGEAFVDTNLTALGEEIKVVTEGE